jgi:hypothetical protein
VAIYRLLREASFDQDDIDRMAAAYEAALKLLCPADRTDPLTQLIARRIIEIYSNGERDASCVCTRALNELGVPAAAVLGFLGLSFTHPIWQRAASWPPWSRRAHER